MGVKRITLLLVGLLAACTSQDVWQSDAPVTPISYDVPAETLDRTIGKLRRLAIMPGAFESTVHERLGESLSAQRYHPNADALRTELVSGAASFLSGERGYEVQTLDSPGLSELDIEKLARLSENCSELIVAWAGEPNISELTPLDVQSCVEQIGFLLNVDGLLVVSGSLLSDADWRIALTILTASLAWPTIMAQEQIQASADLFEVSSGQVVWRSRFSKSAAEPTPIWVVVGLLLEDIEHAIPKVLID